MRAPHLDEETLPSCVDNVVGRVLGPCIGTPADSGRRAGAQALRSSREWASQRALWYRRAVLGGRRWREKRMSERGRPASRDAMIDMAEEPGQRGLHGWCGAAPDAGVLSSQRRPRAGNATSSQQVPAADGRAGSIPRGTSPAAVASSAGQAKGDLLEPPSSNPCNPQRPNNRLWRRCGRRWDAAGTLLGRRLPSGHGPSVGIPAMCGHVLSCDGGLWRRQRSPTTKRVAAHQQKRKAAVPNSTQHVIGRSAEINQDSASSAARFLKSIKK